MNDSSQSYDTNVDEAEIEKFEAMAAAWWDPDGDFAPLHRMNPHRLEYIDRRASLAERRVLDIGCGGGLLSEAMALAGADVTGIDMGDTALGVARAHSERSGLEIEYLKTSAEKLAGERAGQFDTVTCLEMLEHVPEPARIIDACRRLVRPGGDVFFSTINRNAKSFLLAIVAAEYVLSMLPRGTHEYDRLIRPSELDGWARAAGLKLRDLSGFRYNPLTREFRITADVDVNYIAHFQSPSTV